LELQNGSRKKSFEKTLKSLGGFEKSNYLCSRFGNKATFKRHNESKTVNKKTCKMVLEFTSNPQNFGNKIFEKTLKKFWGF